MRRVAFTLIGGSNWIGGYNYLLNLLNALSRHQSGRITPVLFVAEECAEELGELAAVQNIEIVTTPLLNAHRRRSSLIQSLLWGRDSAMQDLLIQHHIDLVFENAQFWGWRLAIPTIAWIPDFQHRILPHLFSLGAWWKREIGFRMQVAGGRTIMLSSEDARQDCERYYRSTRGRTRVIHFAVPPRAGLDIKAARSIANSYGLPELFIFLPNQFWRHKNHMLVLEALAILKRRRRHIVVAASGKQDDVRDPAYFPELQAQLEKEGLQQEFRMLGLIPYEHVRALMRACTSMLNSSLLEGWSTTVEEARVQGTPMLLSDLAVHKEQMGDQATYFQRHSASSLADALEEIVVLDESQRESLAEAARASAEEGVKKFAGNFVALVDDCLARKI